MIRKATPADLVELYRVYRTARAFMRQSGNRNQWAGDYPERLLEGDIETGGLYVLCGGDGVIHGAFYFALGPDPTYAVIEEGSWGTDRPYGVIHRIGSDGAIRGVLPSALEFCKGTIPYIRVDTHRDNKPMQHQLEKCGFIYRGIIYLENGDPRLAYDLFV